MKLWIVGQWVGPSLDHWQFQGVFDEEALAVAACELETYFVAPAQLNVSITRESVDWVGLYYPRLQEKPSA